MWETCPLCKVTGLYTVTRAVGNWYPKETTTAIIPSVNTNVCPTCGGKRIIHSVTGLPPEYPVKGFDEYEIMHHPV